MKRQEKQVKGEDAIIPIEKGHGANLNTPSKIRRFTDRDGAKPKIPTQKRRSMQLRRHNTTPLIYQIGNPYED
ncbi:hypothetical protein F2Q70_00045313 [Brassica cretica]|uniref:Uncharacterized protein n=1 Tax=Brassica cretica TaxID=69181 RepID=A0A8S9KGM2_BRACR|nr:hypothetical protein F2Q70_00045313 [Brassica cretica]KAF2606481.1 hypothetical protein F2Q68_00046316 [Brassica cretica]